MQHGAAMDRGWHAPIDNYCERAEAAFWAEPVNALSNGAFLVAALAAFLLWRRMGHRDGPVLVLIGITAVVGIGSFLFHTFANRWSMLADVIPIMLFIIGFFWLAMRRFVALSPVVAVAVTAIFLILNPLFVMAWRSLIGTGPVATLNGSIGYLPAALAMFATALLLRHMASRAGAFIANAKNRNWNPLSPADEAAYTRTHVVAPVDTARQLAMAGLVFLVSLGFRALDQALCPVIPIGTHFLWHIMNALVLFLLLRAAIRHRAMLSGDPDRKAPAPA